MRIFLLFIITILTHNSIQAQPDDGGGGHYPMVEIKPRFNGDLNAYLASNLRLTEEIKNNGGRVVVEFLIDTTGNISNVYIMRNQQNAALTPLEKEVLRVVRIMPPWIPGKLKGKKVAVKYSLPVRIN